MLKRNILVLVVGLLACTGTTTGQEKQKSVVNSKGEMVITPQMEELARRRREVLDNPTFLTLKIVPVTSEQSEGAKKGIGPYKAGSKISFELLATNRLIEPFEVTLTSDQNRPQLLKNGEPVPYRQKTAKAIEDEEKHGLTSYTSVLSLWLYPNKTQSLSVIDLGDWYGSLEPGLYELTIKHRFQGGGRWIELPPITFEVVPK